MGRGKSEHHVAVGQRQTEQSLRQVCRYRLAEGAEEDDAEKLISYNSCICIIRKKGEDDVDVVIYDVRDYNGNSLTFSKTSLRHLKEFLKQNGLVANTKQQIMKDYTVADGGQTDPVKIK